MNIKQVIRFSFIPPHIDNDSDGKNRYNGISIYSTFCNILERLGYQIYCKTAFRNSQRLPEEYAYQMEQIVTQKLLCIPTCREIVIIGKDDYHRISATPYHYGILVTDAEDAKRYAREHGYSV